jgi:hypothetical protein
MRVEGAEPLKINIEGEVVISKTIDVEIKKGLINFIIPSE